MASTSQHCEITEDEPFEFETEHTVLRSNGDYCNLVKYLVVLENMRVKAIKDIEELNLILNRATEDPAQFVEALKTNKIDFLTRQVIPDPPETVWSQTELDLVSEEPNSTEMKSEVSDGEGQMKVRGRVFTDNKPETFNQLWSCEEQRRLEELLEIYPEEEVEARRYKKIAAALGTRTPTQVYSRVQKYFLKLAKLGLPIPGRHPKTWKGRKNSYLEMRKDSKNVLHRKSTFFPEHYVPVKMDDTPDYADEHMKEEAPNNGVMELLCQAKEQRLLDQTSRVWQTTTCVGCLRTGFLGARWTDHAGTDYCTDCVVKLRPQEPLVPVRDKPA